MEYVATPGTKKNMYIYIYIYTYTYTDIHIYVEGVWGSYRHIEVILGLREKGLGFEGNGLRLKVHVFSFTD